MELQTIESDDEIFCGKFSLKEMKTRLLGNKNRKVLSCPKVLMEKNGYDESLKIIEVHSEPNLSCCDAKPSLRALSNPVIIISPPSSSSITDITPSNDSSVKIEKNVYCEEDKGIDSDNTLNDVNSVVNNELSQSYQYYEDTNSNQRSINTCTKPSIVLPKSEYKSPVVAENRIDAIANTSSKLCGTPTKSETDAISVLVDTPCSDVKTELSVFRTTDAIANTSSKLCGTPTKSESYATSVFVDTPCSDVKTKLSVFRTTDAIANTSSKLCGTPTKSKTDETNVFVATPCSDAKTKLSMFRTPGIPISHRKTPASSVKKTPSKIKGYEHIVSPVASYIKNSPIVPLLKNVRPTKPLLGPSAIPKLKSTHSKVDNKENVDLPTIAYKTAKMTKVVDVPNDEKLPQSQWAKKISSSLPRPVVMRHDYRQMQSRPLVQHQEDSFGDLPLQQADLSVCTQKTAVNISKKV